MKKYKIKCDVYDFELNLWIGGTEKQFISKIKELGEDLIEDGCKGMYILIKEKESVRVKQCIIWIEKYPRSIEDKAILVHEIMHAVFSILSYKNIRPIQNDVGEFMPTSEEPYAYLMEFLYRKIFELLKKSAK